MISDIRKLLAARPFEPFFAVTSGDSRYPVPTNEHAAVDPQKSRVVIWFDDGGSVTVSELHISAIEKEPARSA